MPQLLDGPRYAGSTAAMSDLILTISNKQVDFGDVWVHVQGVGLTHSEPYVIAVPTELIDEVFDASDKGSDVSWNNYLLNEISELGSAMLSLYIQKIQKLARSHQDRPKWVIATLDSVLETSTGIDMIGRVIRFRPEDFLRDYKPQDRQSEQSHAPKWPSGGA